MNTPSRPNLALALIHLILLVCKTMAKKRKVQSGSTTVQHPSSSTKATTTKVISEVTDRKATNSNGDDDSSAYSSSDDDDSLVLEGVLVRNPDASSSSSDDDDELSSEDKEEIMKQPASSSSKAKTKGGSGNIAIANNKMQTKQQSQQSKATTQKKKQKTPKSKQQQPEMIHVEFLFCDVHERFFHGMKTLLHRQAYHASHSSQLVDLIIDNVMIGTVLSTDLDDNSNSSSSSSRSVDNTTTKKIKSNNNNGSAVGSKPTTTTMQQQEHNMDEANVFGFVSIINLSTNNSSSCIQSLKSTCLLHCPNEYKTELTTVLSGTTARPVGFFFQERMINVPLEITLVLHEQLVLDMDYAIDNVSDMELKKSLDYGAFIRLAPCFKSSSSSSGVGGGGILVYKYFDDEIFATNAEFVYSFKATTHNNKKEAKANCNEKKKKKNECDDDKDGDESEELWCSVIVLTKTGHRVAMKEMKKMIHG